MTYNPMWFVLNPQEAEILLEAIGEMSSDYLRKETNLSEDSLLIISNIYSKWKEQMEFYKSQLKDVNTANKKLVEWFVKQGFWNT